MRILILTLATMSLFAVQNSFAAKAPIYPVHLVPGESSSEYENLENFSAYGTTNTYLNSYVTEAIRVGKRNMDWLKHMNSLKPEGQKIALTKPGELTPIPIEKPKIYSPKTIEETFKDLATTIPQNMRQIIFENGAFTNEPGLALEEYIQWAKKVDKMYQTASRWSLMEPHLVWYAINKQNDIRGYYFLSKEEGLSNKLDNFLNLPEEEQKRLIPLLVNVCENTKGASSGCERELQNAVLSQKVNNYYLSYSPASKDLLDSLFQIQATRPELAWSGADPQNAVIPVRDTKNLAVNQFLKLNIEDEWKWNDWKLNLNLTSNADVHVEFVPGQTPHVNGLAGNTITMDDNAPLTEWDVQWTIRHEFGHVLGFPDCYVEFYDSNLQAMVNYQVDTTNLMCSRAGRMLETHYTEMKKNYFN